MRILVLDTSSNCLDWLMRCEDFGHQTLWYDRPRDNGDPRRAGEGIIRKVRDYNELRRKWLDWADLIYMPDNTYYVDMLDGLRPKGYPIFAGSAAGPTTTKSLYMTSNRSRAWCSAMNFNSDW